MPPIAETVDRHNNLVTAVDEFLTQMTAYLLLPSLGFKPDPKDSPLRKKVYQDMIAACHHAKSFKPYDDARVRGLDTEVETLRTWGNKDCTAMADSQGGLDAFHKNLEMLALQCEDVDDLSVADPDENTPCSG